jgi:hypothetical protein
MGEQMTQQELVQLLAQLNLSVDDLPASVTADNFSSEILGF